MRRPVLDRVIKNCTGKLMSKLEAGHATHTKTGKIGQGQ